jgi:hypothetical protein
VIRATSSFRFASASTILGRSSSTRSGVIWVEALRTGHSMPSHPTSDTSAAVSSKLRWVNGLLNPMIFRADGACIAASAPRAVHASAAPAVVTCMNSRRLIADRVISPRKW